MTSMLRVSIISAVIAICLSLCGCKQQAEMQETKPLAATVPVEAVCVVKADIDATLKMADCKSQGGKIELTPELRKLLRDWDGLPLLEACAAEGSRLDLTEAYWIDLGHGHVPVITALLKQPTEDQGDMQSECLNDGLAWLSDGRQAWLSLADEQTLAATVDSILVKAENLNMLSAEGVEPQFFARPSSIIVMSRGQAVANPLGDDFDAMLASIDVHDRSIAMQARFVCEGQWVDATSLMQPIDAAAAFADQPPGCVAVGAAGITSKVISNTLSTIYSNRQDCRLTLSVFARSLHIKGTASLAVAPGGRAETLCDFNSRHWDARLNLPINGNPVKALDLADRIMSDNSYAEADSQFLYLSTYEPGTYESQTNFAPSLEPGCRLAVAARIPYKSETMKALRLRAGYSIDLQADSSLRLSLRLLGPADYILPALIEDLPDGIHL